jgi:hypothetical protein
MAIKAIETTYGYPLPPAPGHPAAHRITLHWPKWDNIAKFWNHKDDSLKDKIKNIYPRFGVFNETLMVSCNDIVFPN